MCKSYSTSALAVFFFLCFLAIHPGAQSQARYTKEVQERIKQVENNLLPSLKIVGEDYPEWTIEDRMKFHKVNGLSIAVINNYKVEWIKEYGMADVAEQRPVDAKTVFQAASISKSLNAVGILRLVQNKKLDLGSDINNFLTTWKFPYDSVSKNKKISIANLLSHTAGLSTQSFPGYVKGTPLPAINEILDGKKPANTEPVRSLFEPGLKYKYSGGGTIISQLIVMNTSRQPYEKYMWENVFKPIGMLNSFYAPTAAKKNVMATGYRGDGKEIEGKYHVYPELAAAGLWTNPTDLSKFVVEILLSYKGRSNKVLSKEITKLMLTPYVDATSGLGALIFKIGGDNYFQHNGANEGYRCRYIGNIETGNGVVAMVNSDNESIISEIINSIATTYKWKDFYNPIIKRLAVVPEDTLNSYLGNYTANQIKVSIIRKPDGLWLTGPVTWKLYFTSNTDFFAYEDPGNFKFLIDEKGKVTGVSLNGNKFMDKEP